MAYRDFSSFPSDFIVAPAPPFAAPVAEAALTLTDRLVISLSMRDPVWSVSPSGRLRRAFNWIFDVRPPNPFADARLEALRRFAILVRHFGDRLDAGETDRLASAGYSPRQIRDAVGQLRSMRASTAMGS